MQTISLISGWPLFDDIYEVKISITPHFMKLTGNDLKGEAISVEFDHLQALKLTSIDCYSFPEKWELSSNRIFLVQNSLWLSELRAALSLSDIDSTYLDNSKHFVIMGNDIFFEIITTEWKIVGS